MAGGRYPGMPFNQQMNFPCELTLRTTPEGPRLYRYPAREIETLRGRTHDLSGREIRPGENLLEGIGGDLFDIEAVIEPAGAGEFGLVARGQRVAYHVGEALLVCGGARNALRPDADGRITLRILVDRPTVAVFANGGRPALEWCYIVPPAAKPLELFSVGSAARFVTLKVHELRSAWR